MNYTNCVAQNGFHVALISLESHLTENSSIHFPR